MEGFEPVKTPKWLGFLVTRNFWISKIPIGVVFISESIFFSIGNFRFVKNWILIVKGSEVTRTKKN